MVKYVNPSFEILTPIDRVKVLSLIELAGRTCYKSEDLITSESAAKFVKMITGRDHLSVIEHYVVTVKFIIPRGVSHEMVRHRLASYSQESTRYCNYGKAKFGGEITVIDQRPIICKHYCVELFYGFAPKFGKAILICDDGTVKSMLPEDKTGIDEKTIIAVEKCRNRVERWMRHMEACEREYLDAINDGVAPNNFPPEIARGNLPIDLKTEIVMTANLREWQYVFSKRCAQAAHPNMRQVMIPLREEFRKVLPEIFGEVGSP